MDQNIIFLTKTTLLCLKSTYFDKHGIISI